MGNSSGSDGPDNDDQDVSPSASSAPKEQHLNAPKRQEPAPKWSSSVVDIHREFLSSFCLLLQPTATTSQQEWKHPLFQSDQAATSREASRDSTKPVSVKRQQLQQKLQDLQRQRILLASEIANARSAASTTSMKQPSRHVMTDQQQQQQQQQQVDNSTGSLQTTQHNLHKNGIINAINLAQSLQSMRTKRKLTAAYRLGGITAAVPHDDPEVLSIRFDICLNGVYVACYHVFFDLIVGMTAPKNTLKRPMSSAVGGKPPKKRRKKKTAVTPRNRKGRPKKEVDDDSDYDSDDISSSSSDDQDATSDRQSPQPTAKNDTQKQLYVRLTQHTIPSAIPLAEICETTLGGSLFCLGDWNDDDERPDNGVWNTGGFQKRLQLFNRQCYQACTGWEQRKQAWEFLIRKQQPDNQKEEYDRCCSSEGAVCRGRLEVTAVSTPASNALHQVSFQLSWRWCQKSSTKHQSFEPDSHNVTLVYGDWLSGLPSSVKVELAAATVETERDINRRGRTLSPQPFQAIQKAFLKDAVEPAVNVLEESWRERANKSKSKPRR